MIFIVRRQCSVFQRVPRKNFLIGFVSSRLTLVLEEERDSLRSNVKALEEALLLVQVLLIHIAAKGHKSGYDWNSDPEYLTLTDGEIHERINKALEATCTK